MVSNRCISLYCILYLSLCLFVSFLEKSILEKIREVPLEFYKKCKKECVNEKKRQTHKETNSD